MSGYEVAADSAAAERAAAWKPSKEDGHPRQVGGRIVKVSTFDRDGSRARIYTLETAFERGGSVSEPFWSIWSWEPAAGQSVSRMTRLLDGLNLEVGDHLLCTYGGRKQFSDGSGKSWLDYAFSRVDPGQAAPPPQQVPDYEGFEPDMDAPEPDAPEPFTEVPI